MHAGCRRSPRTWRFAGWRGASACPPATTPPRAYRLRAAGCAVRCRCRQQRPFRRRPRGAPRAGWKDRRRSGTGAHAAPRDLGIGAVKPPAIPRLDHDAVHGNSHTAGASFIHQRLLHGMQHWNPAQAVRAARTSAGSPSSVKMARPAIGVWRRDTGAHFAAIHRHRTGAALREPAAEARALQAEFVLQHIQQRRVGRRLAPAAFSWIDRQLPALLRHAPHPLAKRRRASTPSALVRPRVRVRDHAAHMRYNRIESEDEVVLEPPSVAPMPPRSGCMASVRMATTSRPCVP